MIVFYADSVPRIVSPSISLPSAHLIDSSSINSASRWWSAIVPVPPVAAGSIVRLRFHCPGFQAPGDALQVYDQGDTLTSSVICSPCSSMASVTTCVVQGPNKVCVCTHSDRMPGSRLDIPSLQPAASICMHMNSEHRLNAMRNFFASVTF